YAFILHANVPQTTHLRADCLFFGVLLAYLHHYRPAVLERVARRRARLFVLGGVLLLPMIFRKELCVGILDRVPNVFGGTLLMVGYGAVLIPTVHAPIGEGRFGRLLGSRLARGLAFIGAYSYPIYLWHMDVTDLPMRYFQMPASHSLLRNSLL